MNRFKDNIADEFYRHLSLCRPLHVRVPLMFYLANERFPTRVGDEFCQHLHCRQWEISDE